MKKNVTYFFLLLCLPACQMKSQTPNAKSAAHGAVEFQEVEEVEAIQQIDATSSAIPIETKIEVAKRRPIQDGAAPAQLNASVTATCPARSSLGAGDYENLARKAWSCFHEDSTVRRFMENLPFGARAGFGAYLIRLEGQITFHEDDRFTTDRFAAGCYFLGKDEYRSPNHQHIRGYPLRIQHRDEANDRWVEVATGEFIPPFVSWEDPSHTSFKIGFRNLAAPNLAELDLVRCVRNAPDHAATVVDVYKKLLDRVPSPQEIRAQVSAIVWQRLDRVAFEGMIANSAEYKSKQAPTAPPPPQAPAPAPAPVRNYGRVALIRYDQTDATHTGARYRLDAVAGPGILGFLASELPPDGAAVYRCVEYAPGFGAENPNAMRAEFLSLDSNCEVTAGRRVAKGGDLLGYSWHAAPDTIALDRCLQDKNGFRHNFASQSGQSCEGASMEVSSFIHLRR